MTPSCSIRRGRYVVLCAALLGVLQPESARAQASSTAGPVRSAWLAPAQPATLFGAPAPGPGLAEARRAAPSEVVTALAVVGAGVALVYGGREVQDAIGFPGAVLRYTGYAAVVAGALFGCGCL
ncbi:MAG TPA: hypothetical protein VE913_17825 [Longimicrobium sp.]|nr:hypothetical protein [Longimicrobium sp.]